MAKRKTVKKAAAQGEIPEMRVYKLVFGVVLAAVLTVISLACVSYVFTYASDSVVTEGGRYANIIGRFGGKISAAVMGRMGFSAFFILFCGLAISLYVILGRPVKKLLPLFVNMLVLSLWASTALAYIPNDYYLTGSWGYKLHGLLSGYLGMGLIIILVVVPMIWFIIYKNLTPDKINKELNERERRRELRRRQKEEANLPFARDEDSVDAGHEKEEIFSETAYALEDIYDKDEEAENEEPIVEDCIEGDIIVSENGQAAEQYNDDEDDLVKKFGPYDPTLELKDYQPPTLDMLRENRDEIQADKEDLAAKRRLIVETLNHYNINVARINSTVGPTVTLHEIVPAPGVKVSKIKNLEDDIALSLSALGIRIIAPIPGKGTIGIEVPNKDPKMVSMRSVIASDEFRDTKADLPVAIGRTIENRAFVFDLAKMPHLLLAGATGQGKSVGLNAVLTSLLYKKHPSQVKFVLVDPKKVELSLYAKIERHFLAKLPGTSDAIITDNQRVINTLNSLCKEMDERYDLLKNAYVKNIKEYNAKFVARRLNPEKGHRYLPYIVLVIDEFADLIMTAGKEVEMPIARLAQLARAIGIHLIIATQRPSVNVITGIIKANFPARIAFRVTSKIDSRTILDSSGADQLIGRGDMLFSAGSELVRIQCAFIDTDEVEEICEFIGSQKAYPTAMELPKPDAEDESSAGGGGSAEERDPRFEEAARCVVALQQGSASVLQRKMSLGYNRAGRIVDQLEAAGILGAFNGAKGREVLIQDEGTLNRKLEALKGGGSGSEAGLSDTDFEDED